MATTPHLSATTPSLLRKPYNSTLGDNATLDDNDAKLGDNATSLLMTMTMTTTATVVVVYGGGSGKDNKDSGGDIQTTMNLKRWTINNQQKETQQLVRTRVKTLSSNRNRDGNTADSDGDGICVCNGG